MTRREAFACLVALVLSPAAKALEFSVFPAINRPDLLMILAITLGLFSSVWVSLPGGFIIGLLEDLITMRVPGARAVSLAVASSVASSLKRFLNPETFFSRILITALAAFLGDLTAYGLLNIAGANVGFGYFRTVVAYSTVWSVVAQIPVGFLVKKAVKILLAIFPDDDDLDRRAWA